ncbi:uncharacterized protein sS8_0043 [Methylocaldum marinum]|uniref:Uncharacterized protein n=1 Tax=Methylocaldum marinum TaxID=1432792 RepID=A0A286T5L4_9GAMM|nr:hypothetical protein [Methylocaldum marinum]BBA32013.1 uncharacterized protein sS8_0043 [Methylocaldum marinum]
MPTYKLLQSKSNDVVYPANTSASRLLYFYLFQKVSLGDPFLQTASIKKQTWHVGKLKSRCMLEARCSEAEQKLNAKFNPSMENKREMKKSVPDRFP